MNSSDGLSPSHSQQEEHRCRVPIWSKNSSSSRTTTAELAPSPVPCARRHPPSPVSPAVVNPLKQRPRKRRIQLKKRVMGTENRSSPNTGNTVYQLNPRGGTRGLSSNDEMEEGPSPRSPSFLSSPCTASQASGPATPTSSSALSCRSSSVNSARSSRCANDEDDDAKTAGVDFDDDELVLMENTKQCVCQDRRGWNPMSLPNEIRNCCREQEQGQREAAMEKSTREFSSPDGFRCEDDRRILSPYGTARDGEPWAPKENGSGEDDPHHHHHHSHSHSQYQQRIQAGRVASAPVAVSSPIGLRPLSPLLFTSSRSLPVSPVSSASPSSSSLGKHAIPSPPSLDRTRKPVDLECRELECRELEKKAQHRLQPQEDDPQKQKSADPVDGEEGVERSCPTALWGRIVQDRRSGHGSPLLKQHLSREEEEEAPVSSREKKVESPHSDRDVGIDDEPQYTFDPNYRFPPVTSTPPSATATGPHPQPLRREGSVEDIFFVDDSSVGTSSVRDSSTCANDHSTQEADKKGRGTEERGREGEGELVPQQQSTQQQSEGLQHATEKEREASRKENECSSSGDYTPLQFHVQQQHSSTMGDESRLSPSSTLPASSSGLFLYLFPYNTGGTGATDSFSSPAHSPRRPSSSDGTTGESTSLAISGAVHSSRQPTGLRLEQFMEQTIVPRQRLPDQGQ